MPSLFKGVIPAQALWCRVSLKGKSRRCHVVMDRRDRAIALFIALLPMARSSRSMTSGCLTLHRFWVLGERCASAGPQARAFAHDRRFKKFDREHDRS